MEFFVALIMEVFHYLAAVLGENYFLPLSLYTSHFNSVSVDLIVVPRMCCTVTQNFVFTCGVTRLQLLSELCITYNSVQNFSF